MEWMTVFWFTLSASLSVIGEHVTQQITPHFGTQKSVSRWHVFWVHAAWKESTDSYYAFKSWLAYKNL